MARTRNLKPSVFLNEHLAACEPLARWLFAGLWCWADRDGRLEDRPARIKAAILPHDECDADSLLDQLQGAGVIHRYQSGRTKAIQIVSWEKHGNPHPKEPSLGLPCPCDGAETSPDKSRQVLNDSLCLNALTLTQNTPPKGPPAGGPAEAAVDSDRPSDGETISRPIGVTEPGTGSADSPAAAEVMEAWNQHARRSGWSLCENFNAKRAKALNARRKAPFWRENWRKALAVAEGARWLRDQNRRNWVANIDWFLRDGTVEKLLEGQCADRAANPATTPGGVPKPTAKEQLARLREQQCNGSTNGSGST